MLCPKIATKEIKVEELLSPVAYLMYVKLSLLKFAGHWTNGINYHLPSVQYSSNIELDSVWISLIIWTLRISRKDALLFCLLQTYHFVERTIKAGWKKNNVIQVSALLPLETEVIVHCSIVGKISCYLKAIFKTKGQCYI